MAFVVCGSLVSGCSPPPAPTATLQGSSPVRVAPGGIPRPDHVVIVVEENHSLSDVIGNAEAPYLNELAREGALFTQYFAVTHPSQPNYLALFSGSTQNVTDDSCPHSFSADNLGAQLAAAGLSFVGYSEDLPSDDPTACKAGGYVRKHNPWVDFTTVPATANQPFSRFPNDYTTLPTVSFVIPTLGHDMHDGTIAEADRWLRDNLGGYAAWAGSHRSLLIVTWDEDDESDGNRIPTIMVGAHVRPGLYAAPLNHYGLLRTLDEAYGLPPLAQAHHEMPATTIWIMQ